MTSGLLDDIRNENLNIYRTSAQRLREDVGQEDEIARDYRGRLLYELIQNADDAMDCGLTDKLRIELHNDGLWFANSGRALAEGDVRGICGISASTKRVEGTKKRASIGHKGMGFKSVLEISRAPEVYSTSYCFRFDEPQSLSFLRKEGFETRHAPLMRLPWTIDMQRPTWAKLVSAGIITAFFLPFAEASADSTYTTVANALRVLPETTFLFLKRLEVIEIVVDDEVRSWRLSRERKCDGTWTPVPSMDEEGLYRVRLEASQNAPVEFLVAHDGDIAIGSHRGGLAGVAWEDVDITEVSVAVRLEAGCPEPTANALVHVFLPTQEQMPYPFLINGAFASGLSRQSIRVEETESNYNGFLLRQAARLLTETLIPALSSLDRRKTLQLLARDRAVQTPLAAAVYRAIRERVAELPLVPAESGELLAPRKVLLPPLLPGVGHAFRSVLAPLTELDGASFPEADWCTAEVAGILADHGANVVSPATAADVLSRSDPQRSRAEEDKGVSVDPVLRILQQMWEGYSKDDRAALVGAMRTLPLMPVDKNRDGTWRREAVGDRKPFYPPQFLRGEVPLPHLCFLAQSICWGALNRQERQERLKAEMIAWQGLFELQEFKFPEVMRASVLPEMTIERAQHRNEFHHLEMLAAICQLSGKTSQHGRLPSERLGSQRQLFNLARLEVPCHGPEGTVRWFAAYQAYFGKDWLGENSVERLLDACRGVGATMLPDIPFVLGPEKFAGYLEKFESLTDGLETDDLSGGDEVGQDEDEDAALPTKERERWHEFLSWLGVNDHLRAVHFHDVEDRNAGWLNTEGFSKPRGWIFDTIPDAVWKPWNDLFQASLRKKEPKRLEKHQCWFYEVHHLEYLDTLLLVAAADESCEVGRAVYEHLQVHWDNLRSVEFAVAALTEGHPRKRSEPKRAYESEQVRCCDNFWLWRLKTVAFCPTTHGPRLPSKVWLPGREMERRFGRTGSLLPILEVANPGSLAGHLGIRSELTPSAFTLDDAEVWLERLRIISSNAPDKLTVACRHLMELLAGHQPDERRPEVWLPALRDGQLVWLPATQVFFAERRRPDKPILVPTFVLEGESVARAPIQACFGVRVLEATLTHEPKPGEPAFVGADMNEFRKGLDARGPALLARLGAERQEERRAADDARKLRDLLRGLVPVTELTVTTTLDGKPVTALEGASAVTYVDRANPSCSFVLWSEQPWPPVDDDAERLAEVLCEVFGPNWYESFLAIIKTHDEVAQLRLLRRAGAPTDLDDYRRRLDGTSELNTPSVEPPTLKTAGQLPQAPLPSVLPTVVRPPDGISLHPLWPVESLVVLGRSVLISTSGAEVCDGLAGLHEVEGGGAGSRNKAGINTDLEALDRLGMHIALSFERGRLGQNGGGRVFDVSHPDRIKAAWGELRQVFEQELEPHGIDRDWPGFDILSLKADGHLERMIELKSSGVSARTQECTWNEWKSAGYPALRQHYYLYLVGNLRADLGGQRPFVRTVQDPFGQLRAELQLQTRVERKVQLAVSQFRKAEEEILETVDTSAPHSS